MLLQSVTQNRQTTIIVNTVWVQSQLGECLKPAICFLSIELIQPSGFHLPTSESYKTINKTVNTTYMVHLDLLGALVIKLEDKLNMFVTVRVVILLVQSLNQVPSYYIQCNVHLVRDWWQQKGSIYFYLQQYLEPSSIHPSRFKSPPVS